VTTMEPGPIPVNDPLHDLTMITPRTECGRGSWSGVLGRAVGGDRTVDAVGVGTVACNNAAVRLRRHALGLGVHASSRLRRAELLSPRRD